LKFSIFFYQGHYDLFLYYILIYSEFQIIKKFVKKNFEKVPGLERVTLRSSSLSPCLLDYAYCLRFSFTNYVIWNTRKL